MLLALPNGLCLTPVSPRALPSAPIVPNNPVPFDSFGVLASFSSDCLAKENDAFPAIDGFWSSFFGSSVFADAVAPKGVGAFDDIGGNAEELVFASVLDISNAAVCLLSGLLAKGFGADLLMGGYTPLLGGALPDPG